MMKNMIWKIFTVCCLCFLLSAVMPAGEGSFVFAAGQSQTSGTGSSTKTTKAKLTTGEKVVKYARRFLGNPYRYGGTSLTRGTDCSGFTMKVFRHFGKNIPRTSYSQRSAGKRVRSLNKAKAGDLICYSGHVAIYMGKNRVIHASNRKDGIKITKNARYRSIVCIRRIVK